MQVAAMSPVAVDKEDVAQTVIDKEIKLINTFDEDDGISKPDITNKPEVSSNSEEEKPRIIRFSLDDPAPEPEVKDTITEISAPTDEIVVPEAEDLTFEERQPQFKTVETQEEDVASREEKELAEKKHKERVERLRQMSIKLKAPGGLDELETEPAYRRKKVELTDEKPSEDTKISKYTLSEGEDDSAELKPDNPFLHDNVD